MKMKIVAILVLLILLLPSSLSAQWVEIGPLPVNDISHLFFLDETTGWVSDSENILHTTSDGGATWQELSVLPDSAVNTIYFINADTGFALGNEGKLFRSDDGGVNWDRLFIPTNRSLCSIRFYDDDTGFITGGDKSDESVILRTTDGGVRWIAVQPVRFEKLQSLAFNTEGTFFAGGYYEQVVRTDTESIRWETVAFEGQKIDYDREQLVRSEVMDLYFSEHAGRIFVYYSYISSDRLINEHTLYTSADSGRSWEKTPVALSCNSEVEELLFLSPDTAYARCGSLYFSGDGGSSWQEDVAMSGMEVVDLSRATEGTMYAAAFDGSSQQLNLYRRSPVLTSLEEASIVPQAFHLYGNYPNPFNPSTRVRFLLPESGEVSLKVYDLTGSVVAELIDGPLEAGEHEVEFSAGRLASGVYFYFIEYHSQHFMEREGGSCILLK